MAVSYVPYSGPIVTRAEAKARGLTRYFTGKPCPHGHISERWVASYSCDTCQQLDSQQRYHQNINGRRDKNIGWYQANIERGRERARKSAKERYEARKPYMEQWRVANRDRINAYYKGKRPFLPEESLEKQRCSVRNRRARLRAAEGKHTADQIAELLVKQRNRCAGCGVSIRKNYQADHIIPLFLGGSNAIANIQLLCRPCNTSKGYKHPIEWARKKSRLL